MKKMKVLGMSIALFTMSLAACGNQAETADVAAETTESVETKSGETSETTQTDSSEEAVTEETVETETSTTEVGQDDQSAVLIRIGGLKGPTSMGMAGLYEGVGEESSISYEFTMETAADALTPKLIQGELDFAAIPSNLASILYQNTEGAIEVCAINTLGVTYIVDTGDSVHSVEDLKGKTIYATGQGTVPEYTLRYILAENGVDPDQDVTWEFKSEATEIVSVMQSTEEEVIAMLPQPFVTVAAGQVEGLSVALNLNDEWNLVSSDSHLVTGVLVVRKEFAEENPQAVAEFLEEYKASVDFVNRNPAEAAQVIEKMDVVKAAVAEKAIPACNMTCITGQEMKEKLNAFYQVLYDQNPKAVGGVLPEDDFYLTVQE